MTLDYSLPRIGHFNIGKPFRSKPLVRRTHATQQYVLMPDSVQLPTTTEGSFRWPKRCAMVDIGLRIWMKLLLYFVRA